MGTVRYTVIDGEVIAEKRNGVRKLYVPDPLGSTVALLDNTQAQTDTFSYWPYGEDAGRTGTTPTPFRHVGTLGYYYDSSTRSYVRAREVDKQKGRWLTQDPIGFKGGDWNIYRYARLIPTTLIDPSGLDVFMCCAKVAGVNGHCFISTNKCGAYGFHPNGGKNCGAVVGLSGGMVTADDSYLLWDPKYPVPPNLKYLIDDPKWHGHYLPGKGDEVRCTKLPNMAQHEQDLCSCMENSAKNPPTFSCFNTCQNWVKSMLDCACSKSGFQIYEGAVSGCFDGTLLWKRGGAPDNVF